MSVETSNTTAEPSNDILNRRIRELLRAAHWRGASQDARNWYYEKVWKADSSLRYIAKMLLAEIAADGGSLEHFYRQYEAVRRRGEAAFREVEGDRNSTTG